MPLVETCWSEIGTGGDKSCARLTEVVQCRHCPEYSLAGRRLLERPMNGAALREAAERLAAPVALAAGRVLSLVVFRLGSEWYALRAAALEQVSEMHTVHSVPFRSGGVLRGLTNVAGELVLCVSLTALIASQQPAAQAANTAKERLCVVQQGRRRYAFAVEELLGVRRVLDDSIHPVPATVTKSPSALTTASVGVDGRTAGLIDHERLFELLERSLSW